MVDNVRFHQLNSFHHNLKGSQGGSHLFTFVSKVISLGYLPPIPIFISISLTHTLYLYTCFSVFKTSVSKQASPSKCCFHFFSNIQNISQ
jgi:hypothetical protein